MQEFIEKWRKAELRERQACHEHFLDLCDLVGHPKPAVDDPTGERFCFERGARRLGGEDGWADVWKKGYFGWEYNGKHKDLQAAYKQLNGYGCDPSMSDDQLLESLLALNLQRAASDRSS